MKRSEKTLERRLVGHAAAPLFACVAIALGIAALAPSPASAGAGDWCSWCDLGPGARSVGNYRGTFYETESWNSDGKGVGSCTGVGTSSGSFAIVACHGDSTGYNEVYCTACNGAHGWWALMANNSNHGYNSVFTGWEWFA
jgi:hypothetical protein